MAIQIVGTPFKGQLASTTSAAFTVPATQSGVILVAMLAIKIGATTTTTGITDSAGNTWTRLTRGYASGSNSLAELWVATNAASVTGITVSSSPARAISMVLYQVDGADTVNPFDVVTPADALGSDTTADTAWGIGSLTPTAGGNYLLLHIISSGSTSVWSTVTPPTGWTLGEYNTGSTTLQSFITVYRTVTGASGTYTGSVTTSSSSANGFAAVAIREATGVITPVSGTDSGTIASSESLTMVVTTIVTLSDAVMVLESPTYASARVSSINDTGLIGTAEASSQATSAIYSDTVTITSAEQATVASSVTLSLSDSGTITSTETRSGATTSTLTDVDTITETHTLTTSSTMTVSDARTITVAEARSLFADMIISDTDTISAGETSALAGVAAFEDVTTLAVDEGVDLLSALLSEDIVVVLSDDTSDITDAIVYVPTQRIGGIIRTIPPYSEAIVRTIPAPISAQITAPNVVLHAVRESATPELPIMRTIPDQPAIVQTYPDSSGAAVRTGPEDDRSIVRTQGPQRIQGIITFEGEL